MLCHPLPHGSAKHNLNDQVQVVPSISGTVNVKYVRYVPFSF